MTQSRLPDYLEHIQQAASDACTFVQGMSKLDFSGRGVNLYLQSFSCQARSRCYFFHHELNLHLEPVVKLWHRHNRTGGLVVAKNFSVDGIEFRPVFHSHDVCSALDNILECALTGFQDIFAMIEAGTHLSLEAFDFTWTGFARQYP